MIINKVTIGFVVQRFDTKARRFVGQDFIAEDGDATWENSDGDPIDKYDSELIYGKGGVDEPTLALEMKSPAEINGIDHFKENDRVMAYPDKARGDGWNEFAGRVIGFRQGNLITVEDGEGDCFDCFPDQVESLGED